MSGIYKIINKLRIATYTHSYSIFSSHCARAVLRDEVWRKFYLAWRNVISMTYKTDVWLTDLRL